MTGFHLNITFRVAGLLARILERIWAFLSIHISLLLTKEIIVEL